MSQSELAAMAGFRDKMKISRIETGAIAFTMEDMVRLSVALECHKAEFFADANDPPQRRVREIIDAVRDMAEDQQRFLHNMVVKAPDPEAPKDGGRDEGSTGQTRRRRAG